MPWPPAASKADARYPRLVYPYGAPEPVSTERPLLELTQLGLFYEDLTFTLRNHDDANAVAFYLDSSESGVDSNIVREIVVVPPGREGSHRIKGAQSLFYGIAAAGDPDGGFPEADVSWTIAGKVRGAAP